MNDREHPQQQQQKSCILPATVVWVVWGVALLAVMAQEPNGEKTAGPVDYLKQVKRLLRERCYACHGPLKQKAGLRLVTAALAIKGGDSGPAIRAGDAAGSLLLERVSATDPVERMPPEHEGEPLSPAQVAELRNWIAAGASHPLGRATLRRSRRCGFRIPKTVPLGNYWATSSCGPAERLVFGESALAARQEPRPPEYCLTAG